MLTVIYHGSRRYELTDGQRAGTARGLAFHDADEAADFLLRFWDDPATWAALRALLDSLEPSEVWRLSDHDVLDALARLLATGRVVIDPREVPLHEVLLGTGVSTPPPAPEPPSEARLLTSRLDGGWEPLMIAAQASARWDLQAITPALETTWDTLGLEASAEADWDAGDQDQQDDAAEVPPPGPFQESAE